MEQPTQPAPALLGVDDMRISAEDSRGGIGGDLGARATPRILAYGDSLTAGYLMRSPMSDEYAPWAPVLEEALGVPCDAVGASGWTTQDMVARSGCGGRDACGVSHPGMRQALAEEKRSRPPGYAAVLIMGGTNDLGVASAETIAANLRQLHATCHAAGCPTVALTIPQGRQLGPWTRGTPIAFADERRQRVNAALRAYAGEQPAGRCLFVAMDEDVPWFQGSADWESDGVHMSAAGYAKFGAMLAPKVREFVLAAAAANALSPRPLTRSPSAGDKADADADAAAAAAELILSAPPPRLACGQHSADDSRLSLARVYEDDDLWAHVLSALPLKSLYAASATSRLHRKLLRLSREHVTHLSIGMERGLPAVSSTAGFNDVSQPAFVIVENRSQDHADRIRISRLACQSIRATGSVQHDRHLLRICSCYPNLKCLRIDVSPTPGDPGAPQGNRYGVERLIDVVSWMSRSAIQLKTDKRIGPHPWCLLGTRTVETLQLVANFDSQLQPSPDENEETCHRIRPLMAMCAFSCVRSLRSLDLSGVGPGVMATLIEHELPHLRTLRLGAPSSRTGFGWAYAGGQLGAVGRAFPGLTALDVGYANFVGGVSFADVDALVTHCKGLQHLDLSMVMTYVDFGPALRILATKAPNLRSLATHGLVLPTLDLMQLAAGCPRIERLHFVNWLGDGNKLVPLDDFLCVLRACPSLVHLDLSQGVAPQAQLLTWLQERQQSGRPVQSLVLHDVSYYCSEQEAQVQKTAAEEMAISEALKAKAEAVTPSLQVKISLEGGCEWSPQSDGLMREFGAPRSWLLPRQRMFDAIGL